MIDAMMTQALSDVEVERFAQERMKADGKFEHTCDDAAMTDPERLAVLVEEVGEVAKEVLGNCDEKQNSEGNWDEVRGRMRHELCQVAAVAVAWMESI